MRTAVAPSAAVAGGTVVLIGSACFEGSSVTWVGAGALAFVLALAMPALLGAGPRPALAAPGLAALGLLTAFVAWNGVSVTWSVLPDRSWQYLDLGLVHLAFAAAGVLAAAYLRPRDAAAAFAFVLGAVAVWALAGKVLPGLYTDYERVARLRSPVGYWNALALLGDFALPLGLWLASGRGRRPLVRAAAVLLVYAWIVAILLAFSRGGVLVGIAVTAAWLAFSREKLESFAALVVAAAPALAVSWIAFSLAGITDDGQSAAVRAHDGWVFGLVLVAGAAVCAAAAAGLARYELPAERRPRVERLAARAAVLAAALVVVAVAVEAPRVWDELRSTGQVASGGTRFLSGSSNFRMTWWRQAARGFADRPVLGSGAGSFAYTNLRLRDYNVDRTTEPHDLPLQFLTETGLVGFLLAAGAAGAGLWATRRRLGEDGAAALALVPVAYLLHGLLDFDWDFVAVTGPAMFAGGILLARPGPAGARNVLGALALVATVGAVFASLLLPWLADRYTLQAVAAEPRRQVELAKRARSFDPLAVEPLFLQADAEFSLGSVRRAHDLYREAVRIQPDNKETWFRLGEFEYEFGCPRAALPNLERFTELDPQGEGGEVYRKALAAVNSGKPKC